MQPAVGPVYNAKVKDAKFQELQTTMNALQGKIDEIESKVKSGAMETDAGQRAIRDLVSGNQGATRALLRKVASGEEFNLKDQVSLADRKTRNANLQAAEEKFKTAQKASKGRTSGKTEEASARRAQESAVAEGELLDLERGIELSVQAEAILKKGGPTQEAATAVNKAVGEYVKAVKDFVEGGNDGEINTKLQEVNKALKEANEGIDFEKVRKQKHELDAKVKQLSEELQAIPKEEKIPAKLVSDLQKAQTAFATAKRLEKVLVSEQHEVTDASVREAHEVLSKLQTEFEQAIAEDGTVHKFFNAYRKTVEPGQKVREFDNTVTSVTGGIKEGYDDSPLGLISENIKMLRQADKMLGAKKGLEKYQEANAKIVKDCHAWAESYWGVFTFGLMNLVAYIVECSLTAYFERKEAEIDTIITNMGNALGALLPRA